MRAATFKNSFYPTTLIEIAVCCQISISILCEQILSCFDNLTVQQMPQLERKMPKFVLSYVEQILNKTLKKRKQLLKEMTRQTITYSRDR